jgi:serine/threonine protein kinase
MIVIETPSPLRQVHGASRQQALSPIVLSSDVLGKGSFGTVFGPFTASKTRDILTKLYQHPAATFDPGCDTVMKQLLPDGSTYILKLEFGKSKTKPCASAEFLADKIKKIPTSFHPYFILPLVCGRFSWGRYEIQRYGGVELNSVLKNKEKVWGPEKRFPIFQSLLHIMQGCRALIDKKGILITDMKPANMVYDEATGKISLIDLEFVPLEQKKIRSLAFTPNPDYIPIQFINSAFFTDKDIRQEFIRKLSKFSKTNPDKNILTIHPSDNTLKKIARFTVVWVVVHLLRHIANTKFESDVRLCQEMKDMVTALQDGNRWRGSMKIWENKIEANTKRILFSKNKL